MPETKLYCGTSGFAYNSWKPDFYPEKLPSSKFLSHYATRLNAVEVNYTYRRIAPGSTFEKWIGATPETFLFLPKAHMKITHSLKLDGAEQFTRVFLESLEPLGAAGRLGPILFQLPPSFKMDVERLREFVRFLPKTIKSAFEFRNATWFDESTYEVLREYNVGLCLAENENLETPHVLTADFVYLRLRKPDYLEPELTGLGYRVQQYLANGYPTFAIFKHEETPAGALNAEKLLNAQKEEASRLVMKESVAACAALLISLTIPAICQEKAQRAVDLALKGHCPEAMPLLDEAMHDQSNNTDTKRTVSFAGVRCSMLLNQQNDAMSFLGWLQQAFPRDPDVLFLAVHVFSDLSLRNSQELMNTAPDSPLVIQLNAENFEKQGDFQKAIAEYRILLQRVPNKPGIHYRIGGLIMSQPTTSASAEEARKEFEEELKINPQSAGAEYYLGELARQAGNLPKAIEHFSQATALYPAFAEAYAGVGRCLLDSDKPADAMAPLETAVKLAPDNPTAHFALATAYQRLGRKEEAAREFALQKSMSEKLNQTTKTLHKNVSGVLVDSAAQ